MSVPFAPISKRRPSLGNSSNISPSPTQERKKSISAQLITSVLSLETKGLSNTPRLIQNTRSSVFTGWMDLWLSLVCGRRRVVVGIGIGVVGTNKQQISVLETVAKVRFSVVMLDLECGDLILDLFHDFTGVRDDRPENVFTSMETFASLLASLKEENQGILPVARKLAEKVLGNCCPKLKPYLIETFKPLRTTSGDYSKIVGFICQVTSDTTQHNGDSGEHVWVDELAKRKRGQPEHLSNTSEASGKTKIDIDKGHHSEDQSIIKLAAQASSVAPSDETITVEKRGWPQEEKETNKTIENSTLAPRQAISSEKNEFDAPLPSEEKPLKSGQKFDPRGAEDVESSPKSQGEKPKEGKTNLIIEKGLPGETVTVERRGWPHEEKETNKTIENSTLAPMQAISSEKNEFDAPLPSEEKPLKSGQKFDPRGAEDVESSPKSQGEKPKEGKTNLIIEKGLPGETSKNQNPLEETPTMKSNRKRWEKEGASEEPSDKDLGKNLTASKIKVFWPEYEAFYEGTVDSYDTSVKKHKVLYDGGDLEVLFPKEKRWELVKFGPDGGKALDLSRPDVPLEMFCEGTVDSYDASAKKHKVLYDSGDLEVLLLREKRWELVKTGPDGGKSLDFSSPDVPLEIKYYRLIKSNANTRLKDGKSGTTAKTQTGNEAKYTHKAGSQSKNATPQSCKWKDATTKSEDLAFSARVSCNEGSGSTSSCCCIVH